MGYRYRGHQVGYLDDPYVLSRAGFLREYSSPTALKKIMTSLARELPIGTELRIEKVYHLTRGYEPGKPKTGSVVSSTTYTLADRGSWYDPKTGKPKAPRWNVTS